MSKKNEEYQEDQLFQYWETIAQSAKLHSQILADILAYLKEIDQRLQALEAKIK